MMSEQSSIELIEDEDKATQLLIEVLEILEAIRKGEIKGDFFEF